MNVILAEVLRVNTGDGGGLVSTLFQFLIIAMCLALIWWFGNWAIGKLGMPAIAATVWTGLFLLIGLIVVLNFLLSLGGHGFIHYW